MNKWYRDVGAMRDDVAAAFEDAAEEEGGLELDDVNS